jgi:hypothetical protein
VDVLAYHAEQRALLIVEVKSVVPDMQALLTGIGRKCRLAPQLAAARGWRPQSVSRLLVLPDDRTARRRLERHAATVDAVLPARTREVNRWIRKPSGPLAGVLFLPASPSTTSRHRVTSRRRQPERDARGPQ